jgi:PRTRC genetic system protein B
MIFRTKGAGLTTLDVPWPRLLLIATASGRLGMAALRGVGRPRPASRVYHAPLMNVWEGGLVCTGSADLPGGCGLADRAAWEAVVTETAFSHVNQPKTLRLDGAGEVTTPAHLKFWKALSKDGKADEFPHDRLMPMGLTVADFIEAFVEKHQ